jgi:hypothetical protein
MKIKTKLITFTASATLLALSLPAQAAFSWTFDSSPTNTGTPSGTAITATASAWATQGNSGDSQLESATLNQFNGGLGVSPAGSSEGSPQHAIDNYGPDESVLFSFSQSIALTNVVMGYVSGDADFSLLAYTGAGMPTSLGGKKYSELLTPAGGWEDVGQSSYDGGYVNGSGWTANVNTGMLSSRYWLVAAANSALGWDYSTTYNDHFKLKKLFGKTVTPPPTGVPSPSTLPLLAISLLGLGFVSRRRKQT